MKPLVISILFLLSVVNLEICNMSVYGSTLNGWRGVAIIVGKEFQGKELVSMLSDNRQQCARMCWLYTRCTILTYYSKDKLCRLTDASPVHFSHILRPHPEATSMDLRRAVVHKPRLHGCDRRDCKVNELCVPVEDADSLRCLPIGYDDCSDNPPSVANSVSIMDGISSVRFDCMEGHVKSGSVDTSTCNVQTGKWSRVNIACSYKDCGSPPIVNNAQSFGDDTFYQAKVTYLCNDGYVSSSSLMYTICQSNLQWSTPPETCMMVKCPEPSPMENGVVEIADRIVITPGEQVGDNSTVSTTKELTFGATAVHSCQNGFTSARDEFRSECQADGSWQTDDTFLCKPVDCGQPPNVPNTWLHVNETTFMSKTLYRCTEGYENITGPLDIMCLANGTWESLKSSCQTLNCGNPPKENNATVSFTDTAFLATANYACVPPSFLYSGNDSVSRTCQNDGQWSNEKVICVPCGQPNNFENASYEITRESDEKFVAEYFCSIGYNLSSSTAFQECDLNKQMMWVGDVINCVPLSCGFPLNIANTTVTFNTTLFQSEALYKCESGDVYKSTCLSNGTWSSVEFTCPGAKCGTPPNILHTTVSLADNSEITNSSPNALEGDTVMYNCNEGYATSNNMSYFIYECLSNGEWNIKDVPGAEAKQPPGFNTSNICSVVDCGKPSQVPDSSMAYNSTIYKSVVVYTCLPGYVLSGDSGKRHCTANGSWSGDNITCIVDGCGPPPEFPNAIANFNNTYKHSNVYYSCKRGHKMIQKSPHLKCIDSWTGYLDSDPCAPINCGKPPALHNTNMTYNETTFGEKVIYTCYNALKASNSYTKSCNETGHWSGEGEFECLEKTCELSLVMNTTILNTSRKEQYLTGDVVVYVCDIGFELIGNAFNKTCLENGSWSNENIRCMPNRCGPPPSMNNTLMTLEDGGDDLQALFTCLPAFISLTQQNTTLYNCTSNHTWIGTPLKCWSEDCLSPPHVPNTVPSVIISPYKILAKHKCDEGHQHWCFDSKSCSIDGKWRKKRIECKIIDCGIPPEIENSYMNFINTTYNSTVTYSCHKGYKLTAFLSKRCTDSGEWSEELIECTNELMVCPMPPQEPHATVSYSTLVNSRAPIANYKCDLGYTRYLTNYSKACNFMRWIDSTKLRCSPVVCPAPPRLRNGLLREHYNEGYFYRDAVEYHCKVGFQLAGVKSGASRYRECLADGSWSTNILECFKSGQVACSNPLQIENTTLKLISYQGNAIYTCLPGYGNDSISIACVQGRWVIPRPISCQPIDCGPPPQPHEANVTFCSTTFGSNAMYSCKEGYQQTAPRRSTCQENGQWSAIKTECIPQFPCPMPLPTIPNANRELISIKDYTFLKYTCADGFISKAPEHIISCTKGKWTVYNSWQCLSTENCLPLPEIDNGNLTQHRFVFYQSDVHFLASYKCNEGFRPKGYDSSVSVDNPVMDIYCNTSTGWTELPICITDCGNPPQPNVITDNEEENNPDKLSSSSNVGITGRLDVAIIDTSAPVVKLEQQLSNGSSHFSRTVFACVDPYVGAVGMSVCQQNGTWSPVNMVCKKNQCKNPPVMNNSLLLLQDYNSRTKESGWNLVCADEYLLLGKSVPIRCEMNTSTYEEMWSDLKNPRCQRIRWSNVSDEDLEVEIPWDFVEYFEWIKMCSLNKLVGEKETLFMIKQKLTGNYKFRVNYAADVDYSYGVVHYFHDAFIREKVTFRVDIGRPIEHCVTIFVNNSTVVLSVNSRDVLEVNSTKNLEKVAKYAIFQSSKLSVYFQFGRKNVLISKTENNIF